MIDKLKQYIEKAERILITSHVSPDPDAVSSVLLIGTTLKLNFPHKKVQMAIEEEPYGLDFLTDYNQIEFKSLAEAVTEFNPDLFIMVDAMNIDRCTRKDEASVRKHLRDSQASIVVIDHHQKVDPEEAEVFLLSETIAAAQDVYELCFEELKFNKPDGYAQTALTGIFADSGGFIYPSPRYKQTFQLVSKLVEAGASIEVIKNSLDRYSEDQVKVLAELAFNLSHQEDFTYSFISDEFASTWQKDAKPISELQTACKKFNNTYIRNIDNRQWGFLVYPDLLGGKDFYSVSLRSMGGTRDVSQIAVKLDGGGHKPAAGGEVQAENIQEAIEKVKAAIAQTD